MKNRSRRGSITIEATIALTAFLFMFMMVYSVITIARAEAKIGVAINNVAKEISQYSYIYGLTGLHESEKIVNKVGNETKKDINSTVDSVASTFDAIQNLRSDGEKVYTSVSSDEANLLSGTTINLDTWESIQDQIDEVEGQVGLLVDDAEAVLEAGKDVRKNLENLAENPKELMFGLGNILIGETLDVAKSRLIAEPVSRALIKKNLLRTPSDNVEDCLKSLGVVPGKNFSGDESYIHGINFSHSMLFPDGRDDIIIVAKYKLKLFRYLPIDVEFDITQVAATVGWFSGDGKKIEKPVSGGSGVTPAPDSEITPTPAPIYNTEGEENIAEITSLTEEEIAQLLLTLRAKYGDIDEIYKDYGVAALYLINKYGGDAYLLISTYGGDSLRIVRDYGQSGLNAYLECEEDRYELIEMVNKYGQNAIDIVNGHKKEGLLVLYAYHDEIEDLDDAARERFVTTILEKSKSSSIKPIDVVLAKNDITTAEFEKLKQKDISTLSDQEKETIKRVRESIPHPDQDTLMQKVVNIEDFENLYNNKYTTVGGYVAKADDVKGLDTYDELYDSLRLDYLKTDGTKAFDPKTDEYMGVLKFRTDEVSMMDIPYGEALDGNIMKQGENDPFTGNGFTGATNGAIIPEYKCSTYLEIEDGAELYKVYKDGREPELVAVYNAMENKFIPKK